MACRIGNIMVNLLLCPKFIEVCPLFLFVFSSTPFCYHRYLLFWPGKYDDLSVSHSILHFQLSKIFTTTVP